MYARRMPNMIVEQGIVEVQPDVCHRNEHDGRKVVGLIANLALAHGWVEMTPNQARMIGGWLIDAADETDRLMNG
jgi:hypothetical protein